MHIIITILYLFCQLASFGQKDIDAKFIFKTQLFLEKINVANIKGFEQKDKVLFQFFTDHLELRPDTLRSIGFPKDYVFLSVDAKTGIVFDKSVMRSDSTFALLIGQDCSSYVLAINKGSGMSYRLKGFKGNDLLTLFADVKREQEGLDQKLSMRRFLKDYEIEAIDLKCLYKGLKAGGYDTKKYPCLENCGPRNVVIH